MANSKTSIPPPEMADIAPELDLLKKLISDHGTEAHSQALAKVIKSIHQCFEYIQEVERKHEEKFREVEQVLKTLVNRLNEQREEIDANKKEQNLIESDRVKTHVIFKGLEMSPDATGKTETFLQSRIVVRKFLDSIGADPDQSQITDAIRFKPAKKGVHKDKVPLVRVIFSTPRGKAHMYKCMSSAKEEITEGISVQDAVPRCFKDLKKELDQQAYDMRQLDKDIKTRIITQKGEMFLATKKRGSQDKFVRVNSAEIAGQKKRKLTEK